MAFDVDKIRADFPMLSVKVNKRPIVYFDNACVTLKPRQVTDKMQEYYEQYTACAGRSTHHFSTKVEDEVQGARNAIRKFINARKAEEIIFTRNTTEGINLVAHSFALKKGDVVLQSDKEHNSNLIPWLKLAKDKGIRREFIKGNDDGTFDLDAFEKRIKRDSGGSVKLVSVVHVSNIDGVAHPVKEIIKIAHKNGAKVILDAAQSVPHKHIDVRKLDADFIAFSGHKMCGPSGTGVLYGRKELLEKMDQFLVGGETVTNSTLDSFTPESLPMRFEAGLQDYAGIIGLGEAARYLMGVGLKNIDAQELRLNKRITEAVSDLPVNILGPHDPSLRSGVCSFLLEKMPVHEAGVILDKASNVMVRAGMHCVHSWFNARKLGGSLRASLYFYNTEHECDMFVKALKELVRMKK